ASREAFVRRTDESVRISMREIQELTIQNFAEMQRVDDTIKTARSAFVARLKDRLISAGGRGVGLHFFALPTSPIDLGRVAGRPKLVDMTGNFVGKDERGSQYDLGWSLGPQDGIWIPGLRGISATRGSLSSNYCEFSLTTQAACELAFSSTQSGFLAGWLTGALGKMFLWINSIRTEASAPGVDFALAPQIVVCGEDAQLAPYGAHSFSSFDDHKISIGTAEFPIMRVGDKEEFPAHLARFDEDVWNLVGKDFQKQPIRFDFVRR